MFCPNCGAKLADAAVFCSECGTRLMSAAPVPPKPEAPIPQEPVTAAPAAKIPEAPAHEEPATARPVQRPAEHDAPVVHRAPVQQPVAPKAPVQQPVAPKVPVQQPKPQKEPDLLPADYTVVNVIMLVVSLLSCCGCVSIASVITSIIGLVSASGCKKAIAAGDYALAEKKSKTAKTMWVISAVIVGISIVLGIVILLLSMLGNSGAFVEEMLSDMNW